MRLYFSIAWYQLQRLSNLVTSPAFTTRQSVYLPRCVRKADELLQSYIRMHLEDFRDFYRRFNRARM